MSPLVVPQGLVEDGVIYPDEDPNAMPEGTLHWCLIAMFKIGLETLFRHRDDVFVAGNLFWYPLRGNNERRVAPDVMVVFGRPKGMRSSYRQWNEDGIAPQVVMEFVSDSNRKAELKSKLSFYTEFGVEEYYLYDPERKRFVIYCRQDDELRTVRFQHEWTSPQLGVRFIWHEEQLRAIGSDGREFQMAEDTSVALIRAEADRLQAEAERDRIEAERDRIEAERDRIALENQRIAAKLRELGIDPETLK